MVNGFMSSFKKYSRKSEENKISDFTSSFVITSRARARKATQNVRR